jgi:pyocin large subunit-like protein
MMGSMQIILRLIILFALVAVGLAVFPSKEKSLPHTSVPSVATENIGIKAKDFGPGQLQAHYLKHGYQFGTITEEDYLMDARKLLDEAPGSNLLEKIRPNGDIEHYKPSTHEFAVMTKTGRIRTYFLARDGYWERQ